MSEPTSRTKSVAAAPGVGPVRLALTPLLVFAIAAATATIAGFATYALASAGKESEGFEALGWALLGAIVGLVIGVGVTIAGLIVSAQRLFLPGHRGAPVALALLGPAIAFALAMAVATYLPGAAPPVLFLLSLAGLAAPSLAFLWCGTTAPTQAVLLRGGGVLAALVVVAFLIGYVVSDAREDAVVADLPLVLFDGTTAETPYGWRRDAFTTTAVRSETAFAPEGHEAYLKYFAPGGVAFLTMRTEVGECSPRPVRNYTCRVLGALSAGELRSYVTTGSYASHPDSAEFLVLVYPDGSGVSMNVDPVQTSGQDVLSRLQRVDRERFEAATGAGFDLQP